MPIKTLAAAIAVAGLLVACDDDEATEGDTAAGLANPASVFCVEEGGRSEIRTADDGSQGGTCILKDGQEVDEWEYYRDHHPEAEDG